MSAPVYAIPKTKEAASPAATLEDVQSRLDTRNIAIDKVGIKHLLHPIRIKTQSGISHTVAEFDLFVDLLATQKGTHMSRFVEILNQQDWILSLPTLKEMLQLMLDRLDANAAYIDVSFPFFMKKKAPITHSEGFLDYQIKLFVQNIQQQERFIMQVRVPVTSLCPCSKEISSAGAHNQRSHITVHVETQEFIWIEELITLIESQGSCELFGLIKRPDEKYITERAYENPKFVEDMVRDIAALLAKDPRIQSFTVESENFESIHNHSAYAKTSSRF